MDTLKVLVVDDTQKNLQSARNQFSGKNVELICCQSFAAALILLHKMKFDMLLTDLMMPGESEGVSESSNEIGKETPYGLILAIMAKNIGVSYVAIVTSLNHHSGPIPWAMDNLYGDNLYIRAYNEHDDKRWLVIAEKFLPLPLENVEAEQNENEEISLFCDNFEWGQKAMKELVELGYKEGIVFEKGDRNQKEMLDYFISQRPRYLLITGEIDDEGKGTPYYIKKVFDNLMALKNPEQKIIVSGWFEYNEPYYLRLPFTINDLVEKLKE